MVIFTVLTIVFQKSHYFIIPHLKDYMGLLPVKVFGLTLYVFK